MAETNSLGQIESTITSAGKTLTDVFNIAPGPTAVAGFLAEGVFKAIRLGIAIKKAQDQTNAQLEASIRAQSILRTPIPVDLSEMDVRSFYKGRKHVNPFAVIGQQFKQEVDEFLQTGGNPSPRTFQVLKAARALVPRVHRNLKFEDQDLQEVLGVWLRPDSPDFRSMVFEYLRLFPEADLSYREHYDRMADFWKDKLEIELKNITAAQIEAQTALDNQVRTLIKDVIFSEAGFAAKSLDLLKELKKTVNRRGDRPPGRSKENATREGQNSGRD